MENNLHSAPENRTPSAVSNLKILYGYSWFPSDAYSDIQEMTRSHLDRLRQAGFEVEGFCLTLNPPNPALAFQDLDFRWRNGDRDLLQMYEKLEHALEGKDVLINATGINLHPRFVESLPVFTVYQCFDDIDGLNENLTVPAAHAYDLCLTGNVAEVESYKQFGIPNVAWIPMGLLPASYDPALTYDQILTEQRDIELFMMCDRLSPYGNRLARLDKLAQAFPDGHFYGKGWPRGYLPPADELKYLRRTRIGPNIHLGTGPLNFRTYYLPANGVLQICDNKNHLAKIFEVNKEVIGFDTIEQCIDLCRYYLSHHDECRQIAANGWRRAVTDYNEVAVFSRLEKMILKHMTARRPRPVISQITLRRRRKAKRQNAIRALFNRFVPETIQPFIRRLMRLFIEKKSPGKML